MRTLSILTPVLILVGAFSLMACDSSGDGVYKRAMSTNDVQGLHEYLDNFPEADTEQRARAEEAIAVLEWKSASGDGSVEALAKYIAAHPKGPHSAEAKRTHKEKLFKQAQEANNLESWEAYVAAYGDEEESKRTRMAKHRVEVLGYAEKISFGPFEMSRINMQNDRRGKEDGYAFTTTFENKGDRNVLVLSLIVSLHYQDKEEPISERIYDWHAVVPKGAVPGWQPEEAWKVLYAGEKRVLRWTLGDTEPPEDWKAAPMNVKFKIKDIRFEGAPVSNEK